MASTIQPRRTDGLGDWIIDASPPLVTKDGGSGTVPRLLLRYDPTFLRVQNGFLTMEAGVASAPGAGMVGIVDPDTGTTVLSVKPDRTLEITDDNGLSVRTQEPLMEDDEGVGLKLDSSLEVDNLTGALKVVADDFAGPLSRVTLPLGGGSTVSLNYDDKTINLDLQGKLQVAIDYVTWPKLEEELARTDGAVIANLTAQINAAIALSLMASGAIGTAVAVHSYSRGDVDDKLLLKEDKAALKALAYKDKVDLVADVTGFLTASNTNNTIAKPIWLPPETTMPAAVSTPTPGYTLTASASSAFDAATTQPYKAFQTSTSTRWQSAATYAPTTGLYTGTASTIANGTTYMGEWIQIQSSYQHALVGYFIVAEAGNELTWAPRFVRLFGSNDGTTWDMLSYNTFAGATWVTNKPIGITLNSYTRYSYYRCLFPEVGKLTTGGVGQDRVSLTELRFLIKSVGPTELAEKADVTALKVLAYKDKVDLAADVTSTLTAGNTNPTIAKCVRLPPEMSAAVVTPSPGYTLTATASSEFDAATTQAFKVFQASTAAIWQSAATYNPATGYYTGTASTVSTDGNTYMGEWIQIQSSYQHVVNGYLVLSEQGKETTVGPRKVRAFGSNNGTTWDNLTPQVNYASYTWIPNRPGTFIIDTYAKYSYYRLVFSEVGKLTAGGVGQDRISLAEFRMLISPVGPIELAEKADVTYVDSKVTSGVTAGAGLSKTGTQLDVNVGNGLMIIGNALQIMTGEGLSFNTGSVKVNPGVGLTVNGQNAIDVIPAQTQITSVGTLTSLTTSGWANLKGGAGNTGGNGTGGLIWEYPSGGWKHFMRSRHDSVNGAVAGNALDVYLNNSATGTASTGVGTGNALALTIAGNGVTVPGPITATALNTSGGITLTQASATTNIAVSYRNTPNGTSGYVGLDGTGLCGITQDAMTVVSPVGKPINLCNNVSGNWVAALQVNNGNVSASGNISLTGGSGANQIISNAQGLGPPTLNSRSVGTRFVIFPSPSVALSTDYAIGIMSVAEGDFVWYGAGSQLAGHKWYSRTNNTMTLDGAGNLTVAGNINGRKFPTGGVLWDKYWNTSNDLLNTTESPIFSARGGPIRIDLTMSGYRRTKAGPPEGDEKRWIRLLLIDQADPDRYFNKVFVRDLSMYMNQMGIHSFFSWTFVITPPHAGDWTMEIDGQPNAEWGQPLRFGLDWDTEDYITATWMEL